MRTDKFGQLRRQSRRGTRSTCCFRPARTSRHRGHAQKGVALCTRARRSVIGRADGIQRQHDLGKRARCLCCGAAAHFTGELPTRHLTIWSCRTTRQGGAADHIVEPPRRRSRLGCPDFWNWPNTTASGCVCRRSSAVAASGWPSNTFSVNRDALGGQPQRVVDRRARCPSWRCVPITGRMAWAGVIAQSACRLLLIFSLLRSLSIARHPLGTHPGRDCLVPSGAFTGATESACTADLRLPKLAGIVCVTPVNGGLPYRRPVLWSKLANRDAVLNRTPGRVAGIHEDVNAESPFEVESRRCFCVVFL